MENSKESEKVPYNRFQRILGLILSFKPVVFSHHPLCKEFEEHTLEIFNKKLCIGCFIGIPSAFLTMATLMLTNIYLEVNVAILWILAFSLSGIYILSIFGLTDKKKFKIISKLVLGSGFGFYICAIFTTNIPLWSKILIIIITYSTITTLMALKSRKELEETCNNCKYKHDWNNCPGMAPIYKNLKEYGFIP
ncbi:MAG: hypothetical protein GF364_11975 [Candidatus Lokiarchaeota archaeon]|nr:hypothetical protein [Candidatus Lokiarchaeota archaeon]